MCILASSVLTFHDEYLGMIINEPSGKYKDPSYRHFYQKIISVPSETEVSDKTFQKWKKKLIYALNVKTFWESILTELDVDLPRGMFIADVS